MFSLSHKTRRKLNRTLGTREMHKYQNAQQLNAINDTDFNNVLASEIKCKNIVFNHITDPVRRELIRAMCGYKRRYPNYDTRNLRVSTFILQNESMIIQVILDAVLNILIKQREKEKSNLTLAELKGRLDILTHGKNYYESEISEIKKKIEKIVTLFWEANKTKLSLNGKLSPRMNAVVSPLARNARSSGKNSRSSAKNARSPTKNANNANNSIFEHYKFNEPYSLTNSKKHSLKNHSSKSRSMARYAVPNVPNNFNPNNFNRSPSSKGSGSRSPSSRTSHSKGA